MIVAAIRVVTSSNVVHAALWLVVVLAGAAAQYVLLAAEFVAITQVLVYVGAVMVLFLFGTMLTRSKIGRQGDLNYKHWCVGASRRPAAARHPRLRPARTPSARTKLPRGRRAGHHAAGQRLIFGPYLIPFWGLSFVLLAALIGAIVLARRD